MIKIITSLSFYAPKIKVTEMRLQETATLPILWSSWEAGWTNCQFPWWILVAKIDERFGFEAFSYVFIWTLLWPCRFQCDRPTQILQVKQGTHSFVEDVFGCGTHSQATTLHQSQAQSTQQKSPNLILGRHWHGLVQREPRTANISMVLQTPHCLGSRVAFSCIRQFSVIYGMFPWTLLPHVHHMFAAGLHSGTHPSCKHWSCPASMIGNSCMGNGSQTFQMLAKQRRSQGLCGLEIPRNVPATQWIPRHEQSMSDQRRWNKMNIC